MTRKDIEKAFSELDLEEASKLLDSLTDIHHTKKNARVAELEAEIARLRGTAPKKLGAGKRASPAAKYRDPVSGATWAGRGGTPGWMQAYEAEGRKRDEFLIDR